MVKIGPRCIACVFFEYKWPELFLGTLEFFFECPSFFSELRFSLRFLLRAK